MLKRTLIILVGLAFLVPAAASALTADQKQVFDEGIYFFNTDDYSSSFCSQGAAAPTSAMTSNNLDYAGQPILDQSQLQAIAQNQSVYQQAASQVGIPWQMLAVIHLRESGLKVANPSNGQGIYQFSDKHGGPYPTGPVSQSEFLRQTILAAQFLKKAASANYAADKSLDASSGADVIKDTFYSYNGRAQAYASQAASLGFNPNSQAYEGSPYVMNKADARRDPDKNPGSWGQIKTDHGPIEYPADEGYGAFVVYASIAGLPSSGNSGDCSSAASCNGVSNAAADLSQVRQEVVCLAQQELSLWQNGQLKPGTDAYYKYSQNRPEQWCADFASWLYIQAGDPLQQDRDGNVSYVPDIQTIGQKGGNFTYHAVGSGYTPQPGDLAIHGGQHVNIVVAVSGNKITMIGGDQGGNDYPTNIVSQYSVNGPAADPVPITGYVGPTN